MNPTLPLMLAIAALAWAPLAWSYPSSCVTSTHCVALDPAGGKSEAGHPLSAQALLQKANMDLHASLSAAADARVQGKFLGGLFNPKDTASEFAALAPPAAAEALSRAVSASNAAKSAVADLKLDLESRRAAGRKAGLGFEQGVSSAGFSIFDGSVLGGLNLELPTGLNRLNPPALPTQQWAAAHNGVADGMRALADSIRYKVSLGAADIDAKRAGTLSAAFQYGGQVSLTPLQATPLPGTLALLALGGILLPVFRHIANRRLPAR